MCVFLYFFVSSCHLVSSALFILMLSSQQDYLVSADFVESAGLSFTVAADFQENQMMKHEENNEEASKCVPVLVVSRN